MRKLIAFTCMFVAVTFCVLAFGARNHRQPPPTTPPGNPGNSNGGGPATTAAATSTTGFVLTPNPPCPASPTSTDPCLKWTTVLTTTIKNPTADDDLFIDVSQVDALTTTNAASSATPTLVSVGDAKLEMQVLVDGIPATPGPIVFNELLSTLTANLQTFLSLNCTATPTPETIVTTSCVCDSTTVTPASIACDPPPAAVPTGYTRTCASQTTTDTDVVTTCSLVPGANQTLSTLLSLTIGHSYDFLAQGVGGMGETHIVQVQERLHVTSGGSAEATIGPITLKIEAVNLK
jgi:hypothetical protein